MAKKSIFRTVEVEEDPYTRIRNDAIQQESLSWKATGLLVYLLSLPDDWKTYLSHLRTVKTDGKTSTRSAMDELREKGFVHRFKEREDSGEFGGFVYLVFNESVPRAKASRIGFSDTGYSDTGYSDTGYSDTGESATTNNTFQQTKQDTNKREKSTHTHGRGSAANDPPLSEEETISLAEEEDVSPRVARKWWHHHNARGWDRPIKNVRSALIKWDLNEEDFHSNGDVDPSRRFETVEDLRGEELTEREIHPLTERFDALHREDFGFVRYDEERDEPLYSLITD